MPSIHIVSNTVEFLSPLTNKQTLTLIMQVILKCKAVVFNRVSAKHKCYL